MSIVEPGSVLILGAGSSADFGLPLGGQIIDTIKDVTTERELRTGQYSGEYSKLPSQWSHTLCLRPKEGLLNPIGAILNYQYLVGRQNFTQDELYAKRLEALEFGNALNHQTSDTIDDFISLNPKFALIAKQCIAAVFAGKIFSCDEHGTRVFPNAFVGRLCADKKTRNWIHLLINIARHHYRGTPPKEKIKIITFNYDGILEHVLAKQFSNVEEEFGAYTDYFEIIHPHGCCGEIQDTYNDLWKSMTEWANNIWVVNEPLAHLPKVVTDARERAKELIAGSKHIYAAGFAFSRPNCKLLGLDKKDRVKITYHNFNNDIGMDLAVEAIAERWVLKAGEYPKWIRKGAGSEGRLLPIANWIRAGYLGEMPG